MSTTLASTNFTFGAGVKPVLALATSLPLDTTNATSLTINQTASTSGTGTITWSYSALPAGVTFSTSSGTGITFTVAAKSVVTLQNFTVTATNQVGISSTGLTVAYKASVKPVLVSPGNQTLDTTVTRSFSVLQSATGTGDISWSYTLPTGVQVAATNSFLTFTIPVGLSVGSQTFTVTATSASGVASTSVTFTVVAYLRPVVTGTTPVVLDITSANTFVFNQLLDPNASGTIVWNRTAPTVLPSGVTNTGSTNSAYTFTIAAGAAVLPATTFTVTATNPVSVVSAPYSIVVSAGTLPVVSAGTTTYNFDTTTTQQFTVSQTALTTSTGTITWNYTLPTGVSFVSQTSSLLTLQVVASTVIAGAVYFTVTATNQVGLASTTSVRFAVSGSTKPVLVSPGNQNLDTTTAQTVTITQTASGTGTITWSISPSLPAGVTTTVSNSSFVINIPVGTSNPTTTYTVNASSVTGFAATPVIFSMGVAQKPILVSPGAIAYTSTTSNTFTVGQTAPEPITWNYSVLPTGVSLQSTSNFGITFAIAANADVSNQSIVVTATNQGGVTTTLGVSILVSPPAAFIMNFGATQIQSLTNTAAPQNNPPVAAAYPVVSFYLNTAATTSVAFNVTGQPYGNGPYVISASSQYSTTTENFTNLYTVPFPTPKFGSSRWTTNGQYNGTTGAYTGGVTTVVSGTTISGEWTQIQIPDAILCTSILLAESGSRNANAFVIAGSNDGTLWSTIYSTTSAAFQSSNFFTTLTITSGTPYRYFRYIPRYINPSGYFSMIGFQVVGTLYLPSPIVLDPVTIPVFTASPQTFTVSTSSNVAVNWTTTPTLVDTSTTPATPTITGGAVVSSWNPFSNISSGSMYFPGNSTSLVTLSSSKLNYDVTGGNGTIEFWVYPLFTNNTGVLLSRCASYGGAFDWQIVQTNGSIYFQTNLFTTSTAPGAPANTWTHIAVVFLGDFVYIYVNGNRLSISGVARGAYVAGRTLTIGGFTGYLTHLRMTQNFVYTNSFTVPTSIPSSTNASLLLTVTPTLPNGLSVSNVTSSAITFTAASGTTLYQNVLVTANNAVGSYASIYPIFNAKNVQWASLYQTLSTESQSNVQAVYSYRQIGGTGLVFNVRRSSDSSTTDVYADTSGNLTIPGGTTLTSWLSGATAYVATWYDQSGFGFHLTQGTAANQPTLSTTPGNGPVFSGSQWLSASNFTYNFGALGVYSLRASLGSTTGGCLAYKGVSGFGWAGYAKKWWLGNNTTTESSVGLYPSAVGNGENYIISSTAISASGASVVWEAANATSTGHACYINNSRATTSTLGRVLASDPGTVFALGIGGNSTNYTGQVNEVTVLSHPINSADRTVFIP